MIKASAGTWATRRGAALLATVQHAAEPAQVPDGIFMSWRFLGDEPDGMSWNVYRKDGDADFAKIATIAPRDVQPESDYATNPGIVKEDSTPSNYTDPDGVLTST